VGLIYRYAVIDIETTGLNRYKDNINYIGIGLVKDLDYDMGKRIICNMHQDKDLDKFKRIARKLKEQKIILIWQNGKFDTLFIQLKYGILLPIHHDIMVMGTAYDLAAPHGLKDMCKNWLGLSDWDIPLKEKKKPNSPTVEKYLLKDLENPWKLFQFFNRKLNSQQWKIYKHLLRPAFLMYRRAERTGIYLNKPELYKVRKVYRKQQEDKLSVLNKQYNINWNSPKQVSDVLFNKEHMPVIKLSQKTGKPSSDAKVLKRLKSKGFTLAEQLLDYKFYYGANSKFLNRWEDDAFYDGRIHPNFDLTNVVTGRTSCSNPNLQQVPRNKELRTLFTAPPGRVLLEADYSQIELRIAAEYAKEPTMLRIYKEGGDIHTETAMSLTGLSADQVKGEPRSRAKPVNFGFLYGMSAKGFVSYAFDNYDMVFSESEADRYRQLFFIKYPGLLKWHKEMEIICEANGGVENMFGRFRKLPDIYSSDNYTRSKAVRRAINSPVQGTASDLLLLAAVEIDKTLRKPLDLNIVGTVHDSILMEVPEDNVDEAVKEVKRIMVHPQALDIFGVSFKVPIEVDVSIGAWGNK
jgi:DNA polymerase I-like protein with 3'-5' exonuclease and polymerase domains